MSLTISTRPQHRTAAIDVPSADSVRAWLAQLPIELPAFAPAAPTAIQSRTSAEVHAVSRAAACPDLFVVDAPDPPVGERVIADIARHAAGRVLILSPDPAAADRITERLASAEVVRALAEDENPIRPSPVVAKLTSTALGSVRIEQLKQEAAAAIELAIAQHAALDRLAEMAPRLAELEDDLADLRARRDRAEDEARAATDRESVARTVRLRAAQENPQPHWMTDVEQLASVRQSKHAELAELRQRHGENTRRPGLLARWLGRARPQAEPREVQTLSAEIDAIDARLAEGQAEFEMRTGAEWDRLVREKAAALLAQSDQRVAELTSACNRLRAEIESVARPFGSVAPPAEELPAARAEAERQLAVAHNRLGELAAPDICRRMLAAARIVVGTPGSLHADTVFEPSPSAGMPFALLVLDRCEDLTEPDFVRLAKLAGRWVLLGDTRGEPRPHVNGARGGPGRNGRPPELPFAARLARLLERQPWIHDDERLVCRLVHVAPESRGRMAREPLIDRPEIELRFTTDSVGEPVLAEVAFPPATTIADARSFMFHQLGEVLLRPVGECRWDETATAIVANWPAAALAAESCWIDLEAGVREQLAGAGVATFTAAIAFDPAVGWDREKAAAWLNSHLPAESNCRFAAVAAEKMR